MMRKRSHDLQCAICRWPLKSQPNGVDMMKPPNGPIRKLLVVSLCEECYQKWGKSYTHK